MSPSSSSSSTSPARRSPESFPVPRRHRQRLSDSRPRPGQRRSRPPARHCFYAPAPRAGPVPAAHRRTLTLTGLRAGSSGRERAGSRGRAGPGRAKPLPAGGRGSGRRGRTWAGEPARVGARQRRAGQGRAAPGSRASPLSPRGSPGRIGPPRAAHAHRHTPGAGGAQAAAGAPRPSRRLPCPPCGWAGATGPRRPATSSARQACCSPESYVPLNAHGGRAIAVVTGVAAVTLEHGADMIAGHRHPVIPE